MVPHSAPGQHMLTTLARDAGVTCLPVGPCDRGLCCMWHAASVEFGSAACRWLFDSLAQTKQRSEVLPQVLFLLTGTGPRREACREPPEEYRSQASDRQTAHAKGCKWLTLMLLHRMHRQSSGQRCFLKSCFSSLGRGRSGRPIGSA